MPPAATIRLSSLSKTLLVSVALGISCALLHPLVLSLLTRDVTELRAFRRGRSVEQKPGFARTGTHNGVDYARVPSTVSRSAFLAPGAAHYTWYRSAQAPDGLRDLKGSAWIPPVGSLVDNQQRFSVLGGVTVGYGWPRVSFACDAGETSFDTLTPVNGVPLAFMHPIVTDRGRMQRAVPTRVVWSGFAFNIFVFTCISVLCLPVAKHVFRGRLRQYRAKRLGVDVGDLCRVCDHVVTGLDRCPECGATADRT